MRTALATIAAVLLLLARPVLAANACTNPGKDGPATISGAINSYYPGVGTASAGSSSVPVGGIDTALGGSSRAIAAGDLVLVIQMQDADISDSNDSTYGGTSAGSGQIALNDAGAYEYATVSPTYAGGSPITLTAPLINTYRTQAATASSGQRTFQVIRVPQYSSASLSGTVTGPAWNGQTGGVVVIDVAGQLSWNGGTIDMTGRGFRGGGGMWLQGRDTTNQPAYAATDFVSTLTGHLPSLPSNPSSAAGPFYGADAPKGEGIAGTPRYLFIPQTYGATVNGQGALYDTGVEGYPGGSLARGAPGNAGGGGTDGDPSGAYAGGNDQNTGGGGGGGYASGGMGGYGWTPGTPPGSPTGGYGGSGVPMSAGRMTLGGGGGAGTSNNATGNPTYALASSGAPGGGMVLVRAKTVAGAGVINANGTSGNPTVCNDASGGGGGGGAVLVYVSGNSGNVGTLTLNVNGGNGGSNTGDGTGNNSATCGAYNNNPHGPGGGGGGGFVALSSISNATINVNGGANGTTSPSATSTAPYGSSSSPGGYRITAVTSTNLPGAAPSSLCYPLLTVAKSTSKPTTVQGGTTGYVITVTNGAGHGTATGVVLNDALPSGLNLATTDSVALSGGATRTATTNPSAGATSPAWGAFSIPAGGSVSVAFTVNVPAATPLGVLQNGATVVYDDPTRTSAGQTITPGGTYASGDFVLGTNYASASSTAEDVTVLAPAQVNIGFSPVSTTAGGTVQLNIIITNPNAVALTSAAFSDALPAGLTAQTGTVTMSGNGCSGFGPLALGAGATAISESGGTIAANGSCTFALNVTAASAQSYTDTIAAGAFTDAQNIVNAVAATSTLLSRPTITDAFSPTAVAASTSSALTFTITNPNVSQQLTNVSFGDTLPTGLVATGGAVTVSGCTGGSPSTIAAGATTFAFSGATLAAGASCTVSFGVQSPTQGAYANQATGVTSNETVAAGNPSNTATLGVGIISETKSFSPARINAGGTATVSIALSNPTLVPQTNGSFTDTLVNMQVNANQTVGGTCTGITPATLTAGQTALSFSGIVIPAVGCTVTFVVTSSTVGTQTNTAGGTSTALLPAGPSSNTASLVVTGPPAIAAAFVPSTIETGGQSVLTFTLTNANSIPLTGASFTDALDPNLFVAGSGSVTAGGTCAGASGNSFTAGGAGATLSFSGITIPPGSGGCTVTIPISGSTVSAAAGYADTTSGVTTNEAPASAVSNTARLVIAAPPTLAEAFAPTAIAQGGTSTLTFTLTNPSNVALTGATFTSPLVNMTVASNANASGTCTGASSNAFTAGQSGTLTLSGLTVPAAGSCTVSVVVTSTTSGADTNQASGVSTTQTPVAGAAPAVATLTVYSPPVMSASFSPGTILQSSASATAYSTLTITLTNNNAIALTGAAFTDALGNLSVYAAGAAGGTCTGASGNTFAAGATNLSFTGVTVPANSSCTVTVRIASASISPAGGWPDTVSGATTTQTPIAGAASPAAFLNVIGYPTISQVFSPTSIAANGTSTITFTLTNPNSIALSAGAFSDTFPASLTTTAVAQSYIGSGRGTCTGAIPSAGSAAATSISFAGLQLAANSSCTIMVDVTSTKAGNYSNTTSGITATETGATAGPVSNTATLAVGRISISKSFSPVSIAPGEVTTLTFTLVSTQAAVNAALVFTDTFPSGMTVASPLATTNTCGGSLKNAGNTAATAVGDTGISLQKGTLAANGTCTITVAVTVNATGSYSNTTSAPSGGGAQGPVSNTAVLTAVSKAAIAEAFTPASLDTYKTSYLTFTLTNPNASALSSCTLTDTLTGVAVTSPATLGGTCTGVTSTPALTSGATSLTLSVPTLNAGSCTITVPVTSGTAGTYSTTASGVDCASYVSAGAAPAATSVTFAKLPIQIQKSASVVTAQPGTNVTYTISYTNPNAQQSLQNIVISDTTPVFTSFVSAACGTLPASLTGCTVAAPAVGASGGITWTMSGTLDPGATGSVTLTVMIR